MFNNISDDLKKIILAGVGAVATTAEKSKQMLDEMVKRGEITVEQGKVMNEELKRSIQMKVKGAYKSSEKTNVSSYTDQLDKMSKEEIADLKAKLAELERKEADGETGE